METALALVGTVGRPERLRAVVRSVGRSVKQEKELTSISCWPRSALKAAASSSFCSVDEQVEADGVSQGSLSGREAEMLVRYRPTTA